MDSRVKIRPMERDDVKVFFPAGLRDTSEGWAVDLDGELACITGVSRGRSLMVAFSSMRPNLRASKRLIWQVAKELNRLVTSLPYNEIWALTNKGRFLSALGWEFCGIREGIEVFRWTR